MNAADMLNTSRRFSTALSCLLLMGLMTTGAQALTRMLAQSLDRKV